MTKILNRFSGNLICEEALLNLKELAVKNKANLRGADLWGADLRGADLWGADLWGARINDKKIINYKEIMGIGNSRRQLRCFMLDDDSFYFMAGCFLGTEKELKAKVLEKYGKDCEYMEAIKFLKKLCKNYKYN